MARWKFSAVSIAARLRASPSSSTPVPRPAQRARAAAEQGRAQHGRRRRVRDTHLADRQQIAIVGHGAIAGVDRFEKLVRVHRRGFGEIARRPLELDRHHAQFGGSGFGDLVDGRAACGKIRHHLRGDGRRIGRDAARGDAVIAGEHGDGDAIQPRQFRGPAIAPARSRVLRAGRGCPAALSDSVGGARPCQRIADRRRAGRDRRRGCRLDWRTACDSLLPFLGVGTGNATLNRFSGHLHE